jgi:D-alanyl-D-alanine carboxypeptidase
MLKIIKNNCSDFFIIFLILVVNLFCLPTFSYWKIYPKNNFLTQNDQLAEFKSPNIPIIKLTNQPVLNSNNYILVDVDTNKILTSKNMDKKIYPASTTKLATAVTALNLYPLDEVITVDQAYDEGKTMKLQSGEKITVKSLVQALLVYSANDSAFTLANHYRGGVTGFVSQMNSLMAKYNLTGTHFVNPDGLHNDNHYSTVYDLSQLGRLAIQNSTVRDVVKNKSLTVTDVTGQIKHEITTTNELLGVVPEVIGLKTGLTPEAKGCFIGLLNINNHLVISVVAQSDDRFQDTKVLIDWLKQNVTWQN